MVAYRRPESVLVLVYVNCRQVLLLQRVAPFSFWQSVTGSLEAGETPAAAARRELAEETGLCGTPCLSDCVATRRFTIDPRWRHRYAPEVTENTEHEFRLRLHRACDVSLDQKEHSQHRWFDIDSAIDRCWSWTNRAALITLREEL